MAEKSSGYFDRDEAIGLAATGAVVVGLTGLIVGSGELEKQAQFPLPETDAQALSALVLDLHCPVQELRDKRASLLHKNDIVQPGHEMESHRGVDGSNWYCANTSKGGTLTDTLTQFDYEGHVWTASIEDGHVVYTTPKGVLGSTWKYEPHSSESLTAKKK